MQDWLDQTKKDFETCFPNIKIKVRIEEFHNNTSIPLVLRIFRKKGEQSVEEVYERNLNNDPLSNHLLKIKVQMFDKKRKWETPPTK